jgi:hypothetical protein
MNSEPSPHRGASSNSPTESDPISRQFLLRHMTGTQINLAAQGAAIGASIPNLNYLHFLTEHAFLYPAYGAAGAIASAGVYAGVRQIDKHRSAKAEVQQEAYRSIIDEPIDIYSSGTEKETQRNLRWYGADNANDSNTFSTLGRYQKVAAFAKEQAIDTVAVDANWVYTLIEKDEGTDVQTALAQFGEVKLGRSLVGDSIKSVIEINDNEAAELVLVSTVEQTVMLAETLEVQAQTTLLNALVQKTGDAGLIEAWEAVHSEAVPDSFLLNMAKQRLEMTINEDASSIGRTYDENGNPAYERTSHYRQVSGEYIQQITVPQRSVGEPRTSFELSTILESLNVASLDELIASALTDDATAEHHDELVAAIYLLALSDEQREYTVQTGATPDPNNGQQTLFQRITDEPKGILERLAAGKKSRESATIGYEKRNNLKRTGALLATLALAAVLSYGAKTASETINSKLYYDRETACEKSDEVIPENITADNLGEEFKRYKDDCASFYAEQEPVRSALFDVTQAQYELEDAVKTTAIKGAINVFGADLITTLAPLTSFRISQELATNLASELPPEILALDFDKSPIGDAGSESNKTLFTVESLDGSATQGYWYTKSFSQIETVDGALMFSRPGRASETREYAPIDPILTDDQLDSQSSLKVETPYVSMKDRGSVPILEGYRIIGLRIADQDDPSKTIFPGPPTRQTDQTDIINVPAAYYTEYQLQQAGIKKLKLVYWLAPILNEARADYFSDPMQFPHTTDAEISIMDTTKAQVTLGESVKAAFGLPADASDQTVADAIAAKGYSFTPLEDAGIDQLGKNASEDKPYELLSQIGEEIARFDSLNCNLASAAFLLATANSDGQYNQAVGFRNNNDGSLSQKEAHAWIIDQDSTIIDPTPGGYVENSETPTDESLATEQTDNLLTTISPAIGGVLGSLGAYIAWRQRRKISSLKDAHTVAIATTGEPALRALHLIEHTLYGRPGSTTNAADEFIAKGNEARRLSKLPEAIKSTGILTTPGLSLIERKAIRKLYSALKASKRLHR